MKGYVNVKNPLVFPTDASNWSAENLLSSSSDQLMDALKSGLGKKIPKKFQDRLNVLMVDALEVPALPDIFNSSEQLLTSSLRQVTLTKKLQKLLEDMGFDSIKYRNMVEPSLKGEKTDDSYILFRPEQYKSINASTFDKADKRMMFNEGGRIGGTFWARDYNAEDRPLEDRVADYNAAQNIEVTSEVVNSVNSALESGAFDYEMADLNLPKEEFKTGMVDISKIESAGGNLPKESQVSSTGAQGLFQVIESTARSVLENGQFGQKAAQAAGYTLDELNNMDRAQLQDKLLNDDKLNAMFSAAVIVQKLQHTRNMERGE